MIKKIIMSVGTLSVSLLPLASIVACTNNTSEPASSEPKKEQIDGQEDKFEELTLDLTKIQTPKKLIDEILEKSNLKYPKNFLDILEVDDQDKPTRLTEKSQKAFVEYYKNIKPLKVTLKDANSSIEATLDLSEEVKTIEEEIQNNRYVEDYSAASTKLTTDSMGSTTIWQSWQKTAPDYSKVPETASPNISAYIGKMFPALGYDLLSMRIVSNKAWEAYMQELDDIHHFIWKIASSNTFKNWNKNKEYNLIKGYGGFGTPLKIEEDIQKSGQLFDNIYDKDFLFAFPFPKFPKESSNLEAAFAVSFLNLFTPIEKQKQQQIVSTRTTVDEESRRESKKYWHKRRKKKRSKNMIQILNHF